MFVEVLAIVLLSFLAIVVAFLLVPFDVIFEASISRSVTKMRIMIRWLGLTFWRSKPSKKKMKKEKEKEEKEKKESERAFDLSRASRMLSLFRDSIPSFAIIARSIRRAASFRSLRADVTFGLGDPADTAILSGYLWSITSLLNRLPSVSLSLNPELEFLGVEGSVRAEGRVRVLYLLTGFLRAYFKKPFRQFIKEIRS